MIEPISHGVLDRPVKPRDDSGVCICSVMPGLDPAMTALVSRE